MFVCFCVVYVVCMWCVCGVCVMCVVCVVCVWFVCGLCVVCVWCGVSVCQWRRQGGARGGGCPPNVEKDGPRNSSKFDEKIEGGRYPSQM